MRYIILIFIFFISFFGGAQKSVFNKREIEVSGNTYRFIVSGHFYGDGKNKSHLPANTLLANLQWVNEGSGAAFLVCLGDLFQQVDIDPPYYQDYLFSRLEIPLFNAIGNHDISDGEYPFGERYYAMEIGADLHLILDGELDDGSITGDQLDFFKRQLQNARSFQNVFIYSHRPVWGVSHPDFKGVFKNNTAASSNNFYDELLPIIKANQPQNKVFWMGGSLGVAPASFLYHETKELTYIATAIRSYPRDAVLIVNVQTDGQVVLETFSFTGNEVSNIEAYDLEMWKNFNYQEPFNWRLVPLYFYNMAMHRYFWYGIVYVILTFFTIRLFLRWRKKRRHK